MKRFFYDILRDKGSKKISITKTLALLMSIVLSIYLIYYLIWLKKSIDHTLVIEMIGFICALVGLKNNWGVSRSTKKENDSSMTETFNVDSKIEGKVNDSEKPIF